MNKPKGCFLGTAQAIGNAYAAAVRQKLSEKLDMTDADDPSVEYIFSTWGMPALTDEEIAARFPKLKAVFYAAGSVQAFARPFLQRGIRVFSAWGANGVPVAEYTVAQILLANKGFFQTVHRGGSSVWTEHDCGKPYPGNYGTSVGIIGAGMIGKMVIGLLKNYRLQVKIFDAFVSDEKAAALGAEKVSTLPELFAACPVVSNHLANNAQTKGMIDKQCFDNMAPNGVFINTGRGQQVVEADLIEALQAVPTRCAVLDVTDPEPPEKGSALYTLPNVFLTPHCAGSIGDEVQRMGEYMVEEFTAFSEGRPTRYAVTEEMLRTMA